MSDVVIKVENLGKQYRLGQVGTGTITHDFNLWWHRIRGKEDPYLKIGETNDRTQKGDSDLVWAIKDINFEVKQGEVLGIIGKNGAGKSTLLKILSRVTGPSVGDIKVRGRIASVLEVGTGFHPELTGRENIFLNGAILGMTKSEIKSKFDEIVDFSGVERYVDTPVKRYSSGMYVRLAFAVAAHLEPEILIVDEVLAVGDAEFQKKCLGKMKAVSGEGRTVLFVSHNMPSIRVLCDTCLYLEQGKMKSLGYTDDIISEYLSNDLKSDFSTDGLIPETLSLYNTGEAKFISALLFNSTGDKSEELDFCEIFSITSKLRVNKDLENVFISFFIVSQFGDKIMMGVENDLYKPLSLKEGLFEISVKFNEQLMPGNYSIGLTISFFHTGATIDYIESFYPFTVKKESKKINIEYPWATIHGYIKPNTKWTINKI